MKLETVQRLILASEELEIEARIYNGYSGRGMMGEETTGLVCDSRTDLMRLAVRASIPDEELQAVRSDNLGRDMIFY